MRFGLCKNLDPIIVPELKLEQALTAMRTGITIATGPIVFVATLYKTLSGLNVAKLRTAENYNNIVTRVCRTGRLVANVIKINSCTRVQFVNAKLPQEMADNKFLRNQIFYC